ncbi:MAG: hypothetical protein JNL60_06550 [Bacteroidia bacterium]|nr:hypothetical protein [Bacteroidia bacterium]
MKKICVMAMLMATACFSSCKKDRVCECTYTHTDADGDVYTDPMANTTYREIKKSDAKNLCQSSTSTYVNSSGGTTTDDYDCKLK